MEQMLDHWRSDKTLHGRDVAFAPHKEPKRLAVGDRVFLCETSAKGNPGVVGKAKVTKIPASNDIERPDWQQKFWVGKTPGTKVLPCVGMEIITAFKPRITRSEMRAIPYPCDHPFATGLQRRTMCNLTEDQAAAIDRKADSLRRSSR
jgi:predicted RNA-binding protein with PUA-like domain